MIQKKITRQVLVSIAFLFSISLNAVAAQENTHGTHHAVPHSVKQVKHVQQPCPKHKKKHVVHQRHKHLHTPAPSQKQMHPVAPVATASSQTFMSTLSERMVRLVQSTISTLRYTAYKFGGTHFDRSNGIYILDCSDYVDHLLQAANPSAYHSLVHSSGSDKPTSEHYYHFFTGLTYKPRHYWNKVDSVNQLQPGDVLVFRNKSDSHTGVSGHVMVVMKKPTRTRDAFLVRVTDSAASGHSQDTRLPHTSGIGIGTLQLKVNPYGEPSAYAWKLGSTFENRVNFAMARPMGR